MANLEYLSKFMPSKWHQRRVFYDGFFTDTDNRFDYMFERRSVDEGGFDHGSLGEMQVAAWLHDLTNDGYVIFNNILLPNGSSATGDTELDLLLVGPHGILVIEVKSHIGILEVFGSDDWYCYKPGKENEGRQIKSPVGQCIVQIKLVKHYLEKLGFNIPVRAMIVLPGAKEVVIRDKSRIPLVQNREDLANCISNQQGGSVDRSTVSILVAALSSLGRI